MAPKFDVYAHVTDTIIPEIEAGTPPWRKPWTGSEKRLRDQSPLGVSRASSRIIRAKPQTHNFTYTYLRNYVVCRGRKREARRSAGVSSTRPRQPYGCICSARHSP